MTLITNRYNIKPMLRGIAVPVVILLGRFRAIVADFSIRTGQFAISNSVIYSMLSFRLIWMASFETFFSRAFICFAFCGSTVTKTALAMCHFATFCLAVFFYFFQVTNFALRFVSTFVTAVFVKFGKLFEVLAFRASFCLNWFSHNILSLQKNVLVRAGCRIHTCGRFALLYRRYKFCQRGKTVVFFKRLFGGLTALGRFLERFKMWIIRYFKKRISHEIWFYRAAHRCERCYRLWSGE